MKVPHLSEAMPPSRVSASTREILRHCEDFAMHGAAAIERVRQEDPATYLRVVASLVPREVKVETNPLAGWTEAELRALVHAAQKAVALAEAREAKQLEHASTGADIN